jgi:hypothetical protein
MPALNAAETARLHLSEVIVEFEKMLEGLRGRLIPIDAAIHDQNPPAMKLVPVEPEPEPMPHRSIDPRSVDPIGEPEPFVAVPKPEDKHYVPPFMPASPAAVVPFAPKSKPKS